MGKVFVPAANSALQPSAVWLSATLTQVKLSYTRRHKWKNFSAYDCMPQHEKIELKYCDLQARLAKLVQRPLLQSFVSRRGKPAKT